MSKIVNANSAIDAWNALAYWRAKSVKVMIFEFPDKHSYSGFVEMLERSFNLPIIIEKMPEHKLKIKL